MPLFASRMVYNASVSVRIGKKRLNENPRLKSPFHGTKVVLLVTASENPLPVTFT
jgi:hypothetical protein